MKKKIAMILTLGVLVFLFWLSVGVFVVQPIGAIPGGVTVVYWRLGTRMPFIGSADGLSDDLTGSVSLLSRGMMMASVTEVIEDRIILRMPYSRTLYLISTGGVDYAR